MDNSDFKEWLGEYAGSRTDKAVLIAAFLKFKLGLAVIGLKAVQGLFEEANLVVPNITVLRELFKRDSRVSINGDTVTPRVAARKLLEKEFPVSDVPNAATISAEMTAKLTNVPLVDAVFVSDLTDMLSLYATLHTLENSMRRLITLVLSKNYGPGWWDKLANGPQKKKHEDRLEKERRRQWLPARSSLGPLYSLDWSDLIALMRRFEQDFTPYLGEIDFLHRFADLGLLRHVVAHNGFVDDKAQFQRVSLALYDWQQQLENKV